MRLAVFCIDGLTPSQGRAAFPEIERTTSVVSCGEPEDLWGPLAETLGGSGAAIYDAPPGFSLHNSAPFVVSEAARKVAIAPASASDFVRRLPCVSIREMLNGDVDTVCDTLCRMVDTFGTNLDRLLYRYRPRALVAWSWAVSRAMTWTRSSEVVDAAVEAVARTVLGLCDSWQWDGVLIVGSRGRCETEPIRTTEQAVGLDDHWYSRLVDWTDVLGYVGGLSSEQPLRMEDVLDHANRFLRRG